MQQANPRQPSSSPRQQALQASAAQSLVLQLEQWAPPRTALGRPLLPSQRTIRTTVAGRQPLRSRQNTMRTRLQGARARQRSRKSRRAAAARSTARVLRVSRSSPQTQLHELENRQALLTAPLSAPSELATVASQGSACCCKAFLHSAWTSFWWLAKQYESPTGCHTVIQTIGVSTGNSTQRFCMSKLNPQSSCAHVQVQSDSQSTHSQPAPSAAAATSRNDMHTSNTSGPRSFPLTDSPESLSAPGMHPSPVVFRFSSS